MPLALNVLIASYSTRYIWLAIADLDGISGELKMDRHSKTLSTPALGTRVLFFSRHRSEGWPHHGRTFSIYLCPLSF